MNTPVSFPLAKVLKEKGYENDDCENVYLGDFDEEYPPEKIEISTRGLRHGRTIGEFDYIAPTIAEVVMWLYEKHGIWIDVNITRYGKFWGNVFLKEEYNDLKNPFNWEFVNQIIDFNSPTEAYEAAIEYTLNNLI